MSKPNTVSNPASINWRKSSRSAGAGACVEIGALGKTIGVRDSKNPEKGTLVFSSDQWGNFIRATKLAPAVGVE
jgi:hypothetical protein